MNLTTFFAYARRAPFGGRLSQQQVEGCEAIINAFKPYPAEYLAYALATTFHETAGTMQPIKERGKEAYFTRMYDPAGQRPHVAKALGNTEKGDGAKFAGRGYVQLTGRANYTKASKVVGINLLNNPDAAMRPDVAAKILVSGMTQGWFTGKKLSDYFGADIIPDPINARRIINGTDKAKLIASYYEQFLGAINNARAALPPTDIVPEAAEPDDVKPAESKSLWTMLTGGAGALIVSAIQAVNNPWALGAVVFIGTAIAVGVWLVATGRVEIKRSHAP